jgi:uncharacterized membrane protein YhhN
MRWLVIALIAALLFFYALLIDSTELRLLSKGIPVLALFFWLRAAPEGPYRRWIGLGLLFSVAGDLILDWPADLFVFGLGAFLLAHLCYLVAYCSDSRRFAPLALLAALLAGGSMFALLASQPLGALLIPVGLYALTISAMLWRALARLGDDNIQRNSAWLAAAGAALFVVSDSLIGINRFVAPFDEARYAIMITYWLGQLGIAASAMYGCTTSARNAQAGR